MDRDDSRSSLDSAIYPQFHRATLQDSYRLDALDAYRSRQNFRKQIYLRTAPAANNLKVSKISLPAKRRHHRL